MRSLLNTQNNYQSVPAEWYNIRRVNQQLFLRTPATRGSSPCQHASSCHSPAPSASGRSCQVLQLSGCHRRAMCCVSHKSGCAALALAPYVHLQWNHWAKDMPGRTELNPWSFGIFFSCGKNLFDWSYKPAVYGCILPVLNTREREIRKCDSRMNHLKKTQHLSLLISRLHCRDEIGTEELRPSNDAHKMGCELIHYSLPPTSRICNSLEQV